MVGFIRFPPSVEASLNDDDEIPADKQPSTSGARRRPPRPEEPVTALEVPSKATGRPKLDIGAGKAIDPASRAQENLNSGYNAAKVPAKRQVGLRPSNPQGPTNAVSNKPLINPRHEKFCCEIAGGASTVEAYARAGFKRHTGNASTLRANQRIKERIECLNAERAAKNALEIDAAAKAVGLSRQNILDRMDQAVKAALAAGNFAGVIRGLELLGREFNLFTEKKESGKPGDFSALRALSDEELDRQIAEELAKMKSAGRA